MIKNIIFDLNGVFLKVDIKEILLKSNLGVLDALLWKKINETDIYKGFDLGEYNNRMDKLDEFIELFPKQEKRIRKLLSFPLFDYTNVNKELMEYIESIKDKYHIYLLSNLGHDDMINVKKMDFINIFEDTIFSCELGVMKPDKEIYLHLLDKHNLKAEECIFVDDLKSNIEAANNLGINGIQFKNTNQVINDIKFIISNK